MCSCMLTTHVDEEGPIASESQAEAGCRGSEAHGQCRDLGEVAVAVAVVVVVVVLVVVLVVVAVVAVAVVVVVAVAVVVVVVAVVAGEAQR